MLSRDVIEGMTLALSHRGPDAQGIFITPDCTVALGHRRLSILDLSDSANQPMHSPDGAYVIVFNGEIYNFKDIRKTLERAGYSFRTNSDTEVLLTAFQVWGTGMLDRLNGMFALAIYDKHKNELWLFRDRLGKKPLYYYIDKEIFIFASELKSILTNQKIDRSINKAALFQFLHLGYIPESHTAWNKIFKFPSGSYAVVNKNIELTIHSYWSIKTQKELPKISAPVKSLKNLLTESIKERLVSDVPLGTFLSGGTDSSLVTAIASEQATKKLKTFNIGFSDQKFNESDFARKVAKRLNTDHYEYTVSNSDALEMTEHYIEHFDEPFADTSAIPTMLVSKLARKHVTVALTGDGGDELFLGYGAYKWANRLESPVIKLLQPFIKYALETMPSNRYNRVANLFEPITSDQRRSHIFSQEQYFFSSSQISNLLRSTLNYQPFTYIDDSAENLSGAERQAIFDIRFYLKDDLLVKVDRSSMYYGLECRSPFLDYHIVEFAMSLSLDYKKRQGIDKWILKKILEDYLPKELIYRPKWGFSVPLASWLKVELKYLIDNYLNDKLVLDIGLFDPDYIRNLRMRFFSGKADYLYNRLWVIILVHKWMVRNG